MTSVRTEHRLDRLSVEIKRESRRRGPISLALRRWLERRRTRFYFKTEKELIRRQADTAANAKGLRNDNKLPVNVGALDIPEINARCDSVP
jgi:hypothetical protein